MSEGVGHWGGDFKMDVVGGKGGGEGVKGSVL